MPCHEGPEGKQQGQLGGRGAGGKYNKSLYGAFCGRLLFIDNYFNRSKSVQIIYFSLCAFGRLYL